MIKKLEFAVTKAGEETGVQLKTQFHLGVVQSNGTKTATGPRPISPRFDPVQAALRTSRAHQASLDKLAPTGERWEDFRQFRIESTELEADLQRTFVLKPVDGKPIAGFKPGQYLMFRVEVEGKEEVRCYSLSDAQRPDSYQVTIKQVVDPDGNPAGKVSTYFHQLKAGAVVDVSAPTGQFFLDLDDPTPAVLIAGGVGVTPLLSMVKEVARTGSEREVFLYYGARKTSELVRSAELRALAEEHPNIHVFLVAGETRTLDQQGVDYDFVGRVGMDMLRQTLPKQRYDFLMCGPPGMMSGMTEALMQNGVPQRHIHTEAFGPASNTKTSAAEKAQGVGDSKKLDVIFARSGKSFEWDPSTGSLLDAANAQGAGIRYGCKQGTCGLCCINLESGTVTYPEGVDHLDPPQGKFLPCIAQPGEGPIKIGA